MAPFGASPYERAAVSMPFAAFRKRVASRSPPSAASRSASMTSMRAGKAAERIPSFPVCRIILLDRGQCRAKLITGPLGATRINHANRIFEIAGQHPKRHLQSNWRVTDVIFDPLVDRLGQVQRISPKVRAGK